VRAFRQRHVVDLVLARNAARESKDGPPARQIVEHGKFLGKPQRLVQRQQVAVDQQSQPPCPLRGGGCHQIGRIHQPLRGAMMLVEPDLIVAETVHLLPRSAQDVGGHWPFAARLGGSGDAVCRISLEQ
jgi:hypothetical protein